MSNDYNLEWSASYGSDDKDKPHSGIGGYYNYMSKTHVLVFEQVLKTFVNNLFDLGPPLEGIDPGDPEVIQKLMQRAAKS